MSSLAYQGMARGIGLDPVWAINQFAIDGQMPDLTLLVDVPAEVGLERIQAAKGQRQYDRLDRESLAFHQRVRQTYLDLAQDWADLEILDGQKSIEAVSQECYDILQKRGMIG